MEICSEFIMEEEEDEKFNLIGNNNNHHNHYTVNDDSCPSSATNQLQYALQIDLILEQMMKNVSAKELLNFRLVSKNWNFYASRELKKIHNLIPIPSPVKVEELNKVVSTSKFYPFSKYYIFDKSLIKMTKHLASFGANIKLLKIELTDPNFPIESFLIYKLLYFCRHLESLIIVGKILKSTSNKIVNTDKFDLTLLKSIQISPKKSKYLEITENSIIIELASICPNLEKMSCYFDTSFIKSLQTKPFTNLNTLEFLKFISEDDLEELLKCKLCLKSVFLKLKITDCITLNNFLKYYSGSLEKFFLIFYTAKNNMVKNLIFPPLPRIQELYFHIGGTGDDFRVENANILNNCRNLKKLSINNGILKYFHNTPANSITLDITEIGTWKEYDYFYKLLENFPKCTSLRVKNPSDTTFKAIFLFFYKVLEEFVIIYDNATSQLNWGLETALIGITSEDLEKMLVAEDLERILPTIKRDLSYMLNFEFIDKIKDENEIGLRNLGNLKKLGIVCVPSSVQNNLSVGDTFGFLTLLQMKPLKSCKIINGNFTDKCIELIRKHHEKFIYYNSRDDVDFN